MLPRDIWQSLVTILVVVLRAGGEVTGIWRVEARVAAEHPTMQRMAPDT